MDLHTSAAPDKLQVVYLMYVTGINKNNLEFVLLRNLKQKNQLAWKCFSLNLLFTNKFYIKKCYILLKQDIQYCWEVLVQTSREIRVQVEKIIVAIAKKLK